MNIRGLCALSALAAVGLCAGKADAGGCTFSAVPGCATNITSGSNGGTTRTEIVGCGAAGSNKALYRWDEVNDEWDSFPSSAVQLSRSSAYLYMRRADGKISKWNESAGAWGNYLPNVAGDAKACATWIGASNSSGGVWVAGCESSPDKSIWFWDQSTWAWGGITGVQVKDKTTLGVDYEAGTMLRANHTMYSCVSSGGCNNSSVTAQLLQNSGTEGKSFRLGTDGHFYDGDGLFTTSPPLGGVVSFAAAGNRLWAVNQAGGIFRCDI
jgi:hypothetical protein